MRQSNTTFVNLRAALDDLDPLVEHGEAGDQEPGAVPGRTAPGAPQSRCRFFRNLRLTVARPGKAQRRRANCWRRCPTVQQRASKAFPHAEEAIAAFQPNLNFARAYTPDIFNGFGKLGQVAGYYDGNGHYARGSPPRSNLFNYNAGDAETDRRASSTTPSAPRRRSTAAAPAAPPSPPPTAPTPSSTRRGRQRRHLLRMQPGRRAPRTMSQAADIAAGAGRGGGRGRPARLRRRRRRRRLPGPRDLRQRRLHGQRRAGPGRRRQRRRRSNRSASRCRARPSPTATASRSRSRARRSS